MFFKKIEKLSSDSRMYVETTPTPFLVLQPMILNFEVGATSKLQTRDIVPR